MPISNSVLKNLSMGIVIFMSTFINVALGIFIMMKGWGLEPKSYGWIWGGSLSIALITWGFSCVTRLLCADMERAMKNDE